MARVVEDESDGEKRRLLQHADCVKNGATVALLIYVALVIVSRCSRAVARRADRGCWRATPISHVFHRMGLSGTPAVAHAAAPLARGGLPYGRRRCLRSDRDRNGGDHSLEGAVSDLAQNRYYILLLFII